MNVARAFLIILAAIAVLAVGGWMLARPAQAAADGLIEGQLRNGTANGAAPGGVNVVLYVVGDGGSVDWRQTIAGADGRYRFESLDTAPVLKYLPVVEYQGATYYSRLMTLAEQPHQAADMTVYESTVSDQWIVFERSNILVQNLAPGRVDLLEMGALANVGDRSYIGPIVEPGAPRPTLKLTVPDGAANLTPQAGFAPNDFSPSADGFTIASPVLPGRHQIAFSYSMPTSSNALLITRTLPYPIAAFNLYVPDVGLQIESTQLQPQGQAELGGQRYLLYSVQNLSGGSNVTIKLGGLPSTSSENQLRERLAWPILGLGFAVLGLGLVFAHRRRHGPPLAVAPARANGHVQGQRAELERTELLRSLANLDERYERGELEPGEYRNERERGKRRLMALSSQRLGAAGGD